MVVATLGAGCGASQGYSLPSYSQAYVAIPLLKASASLFSIPNKASCNAKVQNWTRSRVVSISGYAA